MGATTGDDQASEVGLLLAKPELLVLTGSILLFQFANAAMLPLAGSAMTIRSGAGATALVAACIIVPQLVVAVISPTIGEAAQTLGRRPLRLLGFSALPVRGLLLAWTNDQYGISAAVVGILVPSALVDITHTERGVSILHKASSAALVLR